METRNETAAKEESQGQGISAEQESLKPSHRLWESVGEETGQNLESAGTTLAANIEDSLRQGVLPPGADNSQLQELEGSQTPHGPGLPEECSPGKSIDVNLEPMRELPGDCCPEKPIDVSLEPMRVLGEEQHLSPTTGSEHISEEPNGLSRNEDGWDAGKGQSVDTSLITSSGDPGPQHSDGCPTSLQSEEQGGSESATLTAGSADGEVADPSLTSDEADPCAEAGRLGALQSPGEEGSDSPPEPSQHRAGDGEPGFPEEPRAGRNKQVLGAEVPQSQGGASKDTEEGTEGEGAAVGTAAWCQEEQVPVQGSTGEESSIKVIDDRPPLPAPFEHRCVSFRTGPVSSLYQFNLHEVLGGGRFGSVHRCTEQSSGLQLAMKIIKVPSAREKESITNEVQVMNLLNHVNVIQLYDAFEARSEMVLIMEYVEGGELFERIVDESYSLTELDAMVYVKQICQGVHYMHNMYVLHLDLKPENILCVDQNGNQVKIIDFGLARRYKPRDKLRVSFGTPEFLAPEIVNFEHVSFPTDMWSLGVITYMLCLCQCLCPLSSLD
ncbi:uncharacterized protein [Chiloscyllium punctatum]|uniref:uncharacterized protein isoform X2 n=1 Tax=Chiloscyllium punctatum TaxID=137246 RepID=UPI003B632114